MPTRIAMDESTRTWPAVLIDPASQTDTVADVVIEGGVITTVVAPGLSESSSTSATEDRLIDVSGQLVIPGLIDLHAQVFAGLGDFCVQSRRHRR